MDRRLVKQIKEVLSDSQQCQRNWDLSKEVDPEHIELFQEAMINSPSNENNAYFKVHFIKNRELIEGICEYTDGPGPIRPKIDDSRQTQVLANLLVVFEKWDDHGHIHGTEYHVGNRFNLEGIALPEEIDRDQGNAIGIASGYLILLANLMGYKTGLNICYDYDNMEKIKSLMNLHDLPLIMVGIGYGNDKVSPLRHHTNKNARWGAYWGERIPPIYTKIWE